MDIPPVKTSQQLYIIGCHRVLPSQVSYGLIGMGGCR